MKTSVSIPQHLILIAAFLIIAALAAFMLHRRVIAPRLTAKQRALTDEQGRLEYLKRDLASRQKPDVATMRRSVLDAEARLRGLKIEGPNTAGRFINTRPASEVAA